MTMLHLDKAEDRNPFAELREALLKFRGLWTDDTIPLDSKVRISGLETLRTLEQAIRTQAERATLAEVKELEQCWDHGPDLRHLYPWLSPGTNLPLAYSQSEDKLDDTPLCSHKESTDPVEALAEVPEKAKLEDCAVENSPLFAQGINRSCRGPGEVPEKAKLEDCAVENSVPETKVFARGLPVRRGEEQIARHSVFPEEMRIPHVNGHFVRERWTRAVEEAMRESWGFASFEERPLGFSARWDSRRTDPSASSRWRSKGLQIDLRERPGGELFASMVVTREGCLTQVGTLLLHEGWESILASPMGLVAKMHDALDKERPLGSS